MGLYDDIQTDIQDAFDTDLNDAYKDFTVTKILSSVYDPVTGTSADVSDTDNFKAAVIKNEIGDIIDNPEQIQNFTLIVLDSNKPYDFEIGNLIHYVDTGKDYKVTGLDRDPVLATWVLECIIWK